MAVGDQVKRTNELMEKSTPRSALPTLGKGGKVENAPLTETTGQFDKRFVGAMGKAAGEARAASMRKAAEDAEVGYAKKPAASSAPKSKKSDSDGGEAPGRSEFVAAQRAKARAAKRKAANAKAKSTLEAAKRGPADRSAASEPESARGLPMDRKKDTEAETSRQKTLSEVSTPKKEMETLAKLPERSTSSTMASTKPKRGKFRRAISAMGRGFRKAGREVAKATSSGARKIYG